MTSAMDSHTEAKCISMRGCYGGACDVGHVCVEKV
jgi:hypothetical protein